LSPGVSGSGQVKASWMVDPVWIRKVPQGSKWKWLPEWVMVFDLVMKWEYWWMLKREPRFWSVSTQAVRLRSPSVAGMAWR